jgi:hypothetical protein
MLGVYLDVICLLGLLRRQIPTELAGKSPGARVNIVPSHVSGYLYLTHFSFF